MAATTVGAIKKHFRRLKDPRVVGRSRHLLVDIIVLAICGVIADCDDWLKTRSKVSCEGTPLGSFKNRLNQARRF
jgi:hypothetical protein